MTISDPLMAEVLAALDPAVVFEHAFGLAPMPHQLNYLRERRSIVVLKSRQSGFSTAAGAVVIHNAVYRAGSMTVVLSPTQKQSAAITGIARAGIRAIGKPLIGDSVSMLKLANGSRILSLPGSARSARGWTADLLIIDEAGYLDPETWTAASALVATGGRMIVQSTPAGRNPFQDLWNDPPASWATFKVRSDEVPTITAAFLEGARRQMSEADYGAEYGCQFLTEGMGGWFSPDRLAALTTDTPSPIFDGFRKPHVAPVKSG